MPMTSSYTYRPILRVLWRYMFALGLVGACVLLCLGIPKVMASRPFLAFWPVVVLAAEFGGIGPGLFATVASILCVHFILNPVFGGLNLFDWVGMTTGGIFLAGASVVSIFIGRKRNIKALQRLQSAAMQSATNGIALTDAQGVLLWANPAFCTITGYTSEEIIGKINWLLDSGEQNEAFLENLWSTVLQREVWHGDLVGRRKDGTTYVEERSVTPVTDADGRIINCVIIIQDITERKQAEDALRESENFIKAVMDSLPIGVAVNSVDPSVNFSYMNDNFPAIYHTTREALAVQDNFWNAVYEDPTFREEIRKRVLEDLASGEPERMHWEDIPISRKGEKTTYINARNTPLPGKQLMISTVWDITERKQAEEELKKHRDHLEELVKERTNELEEANLRLQELDRLKSMFIASMSHELRTPLNSIIGFTGIILMGMSGEISAVQKKQLSMVKNSANHLLELINDVIDVSKIEAGKTDLSIGTFDLSDLTLEVKESFAITAAEKGLNLEYRTDGWVEVTSDPRRVKQILVNLVGNAVKFTETGTVSISVLKAEKGVEIKVRDTGIGMYREDMERLFLAFSRIHIKGRPIVEGTGLGLYLSRRIAALLGGEITAESEPDRGSEFTFFLPWKYSEGKV